MKKILLILIPIIIFVISYLCLSVFVGSWKVKLDADALTVFFVNLRSVWPIKVLISGIAAGVVGFGINFLRKNKKSIG